MIQLELFAFEPEKAGEYNLQDLFDHLNGKHWKGRLSSFRCEWSNRMITTWGACYRGRKLIRISSRFKNRSIEELMALMSHEMIHIRYSGHGMRFRRELRRIGLEGDVQRRFPGLVSWSSSQRRELRYKYICSGCGVTIRRRRKIHGYCAACGSKGVQSKFKLVTKL